MLEWLRRKIADGGEMPLRVVLVFHDSDAIDGDIIGFDDLGVVLDQAGNNDVCVIPWTAIALLRLKA